MNPSILLCYGMNGAPLDAGHGVPIANKKTYWESNDQITRRVNIA